MNLKSGSDYLSLLMEIERQKIKGIVVALRANYLTVEIQSFLSSKINNNSSLETKPLRLLCTKRSRLSFKGSFICVGDVVTVESIDWQYLTGVITSIDPRKSLINRPPVANLTHILLAFSLQKPFVPINQISRFLLTAEQTGQNIFVIFTKKDLLENEILEKYSFKLKEWGYESIAVSIVTGDGIDMLARKLEKMKLAVLCGPSGVGKSSLINYLLPGISIPIGKLSKKLQRGKNTTRHVELFSLLSSTFIADTPGFNKPALSIDSFELASLFPEFRIQLETRSCKFRDCLHLDEPGCQMSKDWERYEYYKNYLEEILSSRRSYQVD